MGLRFIDNPTEERTGEKIVIRWWIESERSCHGCVDYCYEYKINGRGVSGGMKRREGLDELVKNLREYGYEAELEHGHYKQVWVPDGR